MKLQAVTQDDAEADTMRSSDEEGQEMRAEGEGDDVQGREGDVGANPSPHHIWVLCGGTGTEANASLASGIHVFQELQKQSDVVVRFANHMGSYSSNCMLQLYWDS